MGGGEPLFPWFICSLFWFLTGSSYWQGALASNCAFSQFLVGSIEGEISFFNEGSATTCYQEEILVRNGSSLERIGVGEAGSETEGVSKRRSLYTVSNQSPSD